MGKKRTFFPSQPATSSEVIAIRIPDQAIPHETVAEDKKPPAAANMLS